MANHPPLTWQVQIRGDEGARARLLNMSPRPGATFEADDEDKCVLMSDDFSALEDSVKVTAAGERILMRFRGLLDLDDNRGKTLRIDGVYRVRSDGYRDLFKGLVGQEVRVQLGALGVGNGPSSTPPISPLAAKSRVLEEHPELQLAFELNGHDSDSFAGLYKTLEAIFAGLGTSQHKAVDKIVAKGWASEDEIKSLMHTACSPNAIGMLARHGVSKHAPPPEPMPLAEAKRLIRHLLDRCLADQ